jgi:hypothetical protein
MSFNIRAMKATIKKPRVGIYGSVSAGLGVFKVLTSILGYDPFLIAEVNQDAVVAPVCGRAKTFGAHFTIYDIFTPTDYDSFILRLREIISAYRPFYFKFVRFSGYIRGDYQGKSVYDEKMKTVLALDFDEESAMMVSAIHTNIVKNIQDLRAAIEPEFNQDIFRNVPELWKLIQQFGAPYVLNNYSPHLTIASKLSGSDKELERMIHYMSETYGREILDKPIPFDAIYIFEEIIGGKFNGYFKVRDILKLS